MRGIRLQRWAATAACATLVPFASFTALPAAAQPAGAPPAVAAPTVTILDSDRERLDLQDEMARLVAAGRFAEIIGRADGDFADGTRLSDGSWRGYEIYMAFEKALERMPADDPRWEPLLGTLRARAESRPGDVFLYVQALHAHGWQIRGDSYSSTVSNSRYRNFRQLMEAGRDALDHHRAALVDSPMWYSQRITLYTETGGSDQAADAVFREGRKRFPDYLPLYSTRVRYLTPKWRGSEDQIMDLLDEVAAQPALDRKEGLYARVAWLAENEGYPVFLDERFKKAVARASLDALVQARPDLRNRQRYFVSACLMSDEAAAKSQLAAIQLPIAEPELRGTRVLLEKCRTWAETGEAWVMGNQYRGEHKVTVIGKAKVLPGGPKPPAAPASAAR